MKKRVLSVIFTMLLLLGAVSLCASADSLYIKKIVSVVYDNSGSMMSDDKYAYANYAMQTFCGLLNKDDQLYVTYMTDSSKSQSMDLSTEKSTQNSVNYIQDIYSSGGTPDEAIDTAYKKLASVKDNNPNTQYWLVIITDGDFDGIKKNAESETTKEYGRNHPDYESLKLKKMTELLDTKLEPMIKSAMPNGTSPRVIFFSINGKTQKVAVPTEIDVYGNKYDASNSQNKDNKDGKVQVYSANSVLTEYDDAGNPVSNGIIDEMAKIADTVSGRSRFDTADVQPVKDNENAISVKITTPLMNLVVLSQKAHINVDSIVIDNEYTAECNRKIQLKYPEEDVEESSPFKDLKGTACLITAEDLGDDSDAENLSSGTYVIKFDSKVKADDVVVLFEPALTMETTFTVNGRTVSDAELNNLCEGDKLSISCKIYETGTTNEVKPDKLPEGTDFDVSIKIGDKTVVKSGKEMLVENYEITADQTTIEAFVKIKGVNPISYKRTIVPQKPPVYTVRQVAGLSTVNFDDVKDGSFSVRFEVLKNETRISDAAEVNSLNPDVTTDLDGNGGETTVDADGYIVFTPTSAKAETDGKDYTVKVVCKTDVKEGEGSYSVVFSDYKIKPVVDSKSVNFDNITADGESNVKFEVYRDNKRIEDDSELAELDPVITLSFKGVDGISDVNGNARAENGCIVFDSAAAKAETDGKGYTVTVRCDTDKGSASEDFNVVFSEYDVKPVVTDKVIKCDAIDGNTEPMAVFEVYKDKNKLKDTQEVEKLGFVLDAQGNDGIQKVDEEGRIVFIPNVYSGNRYDEDFKVTVSCTVEKVSQAATYTVDCYELEILPVGNTESIKYEDITANEDFAVRFEIKEDGKPLSKQEVAALNPQVYSTVSGNEGNKTVDENGYVVFTPTKAYTQFFNSAHFDVEVKCTVGNKEGTHSYRVLLARYDIIPVNPTEKVVKTKLYGNKTGVSFYIEKDKDRLDKSGIDGVIIAEVNDVWKDILTVPDEIVPADDGTITVIPYDKEKFEDGFWSWINFWEYFTYPSEDIEVEITTPFGKQTATIDVVGDGLIYILLWVVLPAVFDIAIVVLLGWYIWGVITKPRFKKNSKMYTVSMAYDANAGEFKWKLRNAGTDPDISTRTKPFSGLKKIIYTLLPRYKNVENYIKSNVNGVTIAPNADGSVRVFSTGGVYSVEIFRAINDAGQISIRTRYEFANVVNNLRSNRKEKLFVNYSGSSFQDINANVGGLGFHLLSTDILYLVNAQVKVMNGEEYIVGGTFVCITDGDN